MLTTRNHGKCNSIRVKKKIKVLKELKELKELKKNLNPQSDGLTKSRVGWGVVVNLAYDCSLNQNAYPYCTL